MESLRHGMNPSQLVQRRRFGRHARTPVVVYAVRSPDDHILRHICPEPPPGPRQSTAKNANPPLNPCRACVNRVAYTATGRKSPFVKALGEYG